MKTVFAYGEQQQLKLLNDHLAHTFNFCGFTCSKLNLNINEYVSIKPDLILIFKKENSLCNIDFIKALRSSSYSNTPLITVSEAYNEDDLVMTLNSGADDYIAFPFSQRKLESRINACLRRSLTFSTGNHIKYKDLLLNTDSLSAEVNGKLINLTPIEYKILGNLIEKPDTIINRDLLINSCYLKGNSKNFSLNVHVFALRKKLGSAGRYIHTIRGNGYKLS